MIKNKLILLTLLCVAYLYSGESNEPSFFRKTLAKGDELLQQGKFREARQEYELFIMSKDPAIRAIIAERLAEINRFPYFQFELRMADLELNKGNKGEAKKLYKKCILSYPSSEIIQKICRERLKNMDPGLIEDILHTKE